MHDIFGANSEKIPLSAQIAKMQACKLYFFNKMVKLAKESGKYLVRKATVQ